MITKLRVTQGDRKTRDWSTDLFLWKKATKAFVPKYIQTPFTIFNYFYGNHSICFDIRMK